ncbi:proteic killer suppression protein [Dyadobacter sp. SG02]|uniref:type II toxin-antitoxin system RelE/ParE family toxin n=1 Tax=Dyadobacter sp. SG02 TaxID=1855291 RepID=UPI0008ACAE58|nr:type II toxin-antitoxin system RelE/ParE family toxin [Dyadobacter sp. SG02]SEJ30772.1 proteic killer suppression protein [Dyadobacter sp. SG02]
MIKTFSHKGLRLLWEKDDASKLPSEQIDKLRRILSALNTAKSLEPIRAIPGYRLHALSGRLEGVWSVWVTANYRVLFRFEGGNAYNIDYVDYH